LKHLQANIRTRAPNWLPIPGAGSERGRREAQVDEGDLFAKGELIAFLPKQARGVIRNGHGDHLTFDLKTISVLGDVGHLEVGARVGYDMARTSNGNRVTVLKIY
jgi:hypothetical protein